MTDNVKEINKYISQVKKHLICYNKDKKQILSELKSEIASYAEEKGEVDFSLICKQFGRPEELAQTYLFDSDVKKIKRAVNLKRIVVVAIVIALLLYAFVIFTALIDSRPSLNGYLIEETAIEELAIKWYCKLR